MRRLIFTVIAVVGLALAAQLFAAAQEEVAGGPFVVGVTGKTAKIAWVVKGPQVTLQTGSAAAITVVESFNKYLIQ